MVLMISSGDSGEEASRDAVGEGGGGGGGGGTVDDEERDEEDEEAMALSMLQQRFGQMLKQGTYPAAGPRMFEAVPFGGDDILLRRI